MTGAQIVTKFQNMVDDVLDNDFTYQLLNDAKDEVEAMQVWEQMKKETTYTVTSGSSYATALGTLPTRFALDVSAVRDSSNINLTKVHFEDRFAKVNAPYSYFIDLANNNFHIASENNSAGTIYFYYTDYSADLTSTDTWVFPSRFHSILPYKMAQLYYAADAGEKARAWDDRWSAYYESMLGRMELWNDSLKVRNYRARTSRNNPKGLNV